MGMMLVVIVCCYCLYSGLVCACLLSYGLSSALRLGYGFWLFDVSCMLLHG